MQAKQDCVASQAAIEPPGMGSWRPVERVPWDSCASVMVISPLPQLGLGGGGRPSKHAVNTSMYTRRRLAALRPCAAPLRCAILLRLRTSPSLPWLGRSLLDAVHPATLARPALTVRGEGVRRLRRLTHAADGFADLPPPPLLKCRLKDGANHQNFEF